MHKRYTLKEIEELWPQSEGELRGYAHYLNRTGSDITGSQLDMALQLASLAYTLLLAEKEEYRQHLDKLSKTAEPTNEVYPIRKMLEG